MKEFAADSGTALAEEATASGDQFAHLPLALIVTSPTNPRKNFNPVKLQELADSIRASGVHQPALVRPLPASRLQETAKPAKGAPRPTHELVSGERRYRASIMAGKATIPAMIRNLTDDQVLEIQIIENLQRDDLTELEEAEGYERLMAHSHLNADEVGTKIGKSRSYVYARLKLLDLCQEAKSAMRDGTIDASRALLIARIPDGKLQLKALAYASEVHQYTQLQPSVRDLQTWLQQNVMLRLERAPFQITDARLVEAAGSCKDCPKRTGANPDLFADVDGADICTDPGCYNGKASAHRTAVISLAEAKGMTVIDGAAAKKICTQYNSTITGYSLLSQQRNDASTPGKLGKLLGKDAPAPVLIENPWTKELIEAVPTEEAEAVLLAKGLIKVTRAVASKQSEIDSEIEHLKQSIKHKVNLRARTSVFESLVTAIRSTPDHSASELIMPPELIRAWLSNELGDLDLDETAIVLQMDSSDPQINDQQHQERRLQACDAATLYKAMAILMILGDQPRSYGSYNADETPLFNAFAADRGIDIDAVRAAVAIEVREETAAEIKKLKAELKAALKPPIATAPLAQPEHAAKNNKKSPAAAGAQTGKKPGRLSPEEAQLGIAEAMQGIEGEPVPGSHLSPEAWPFPTANKADAAPTEPGNTAAKFAVGIKVVVSGPMALRSSLSRFAGLQGTITDDETDGEWEVKLDRNGRGGGVRMFRASEIEAAPT